MIAADDEEWEPLDSQAQMGTTSKNQKFSPRLHKVTVPLSPDALANQFEQVELNDGAKTASPRILTNRGNSGLKVYFSTEFDVIATEDKMGTTGQAQMGRVGG